MKFRKNPPEGTQSIVRTVSILKAVAERREIGWRLTDLAAHCKLNKATASRICACLASQRLLQQRPGDRRYVAGPLLFELSLAVPTYAEYRDAARPELALVSRKIGGIAFLYLLSGEETICVDRVVATEVPSITGVGTRRLLIESTFGISMLLAMPKKDQRAIQRANQGAPHLASGARADAHRRILLRSRRYGFGFNRGDIVPGITGIAVPVLNKLGRPVASIGAMGPTSNLAGKQLRAVVSLLRESALRIGGTRAAISDKDPRHTVP